MSASRDLCKQQIARLASTKKFPNPVEFPEAIGELVNTLQTATCDEHAIAAIDGWLADYPNCPAPSELRNILRATAREEWAEPEKPIGCERCDNTGWKIGRNGDYEYAVPCACRGGM